MNVRPRVSLPGSCRCRVCVRLRAGGLLLSSCRPQFCRSRLRLVAMGVVRSGRGRDGKPSSAIQALPRKEATLADFTHCAQPENSRPAAAPGSRFVDRTAALGADRRASAPEAASREAGLSLQLPSALAYDPSSCRALDRMTQSWAGEPTGALLRSAGRFGAPPPWQSSGCSHPLSPRLRRWTCCGVHARWRAGSLRR